MVFSYLMTIGKAPGLLGKYQFLLNVIIPKYLPRFVVISYQIISSMFDEFHMLMSFMLLIIFKMDYYQFWNYNSILFEAILQTPYFVILLSRFKLCILLSIHFIHVPLFLNH